MYFIQYKFDKTTVSVTGVPAAPRQTWHITDRNEVYNVVGIQTAMFFLPPRGCSYPPNEVSRRNSPVPFGLGQPDANIWIPGVPSIRAAAAV